MLMECVRLQPPRTAHSHFCAHLTTTSTPLDIVDIPINHRRCWRSQIEVAVACNYLRAIDAGRAAVRRNFNYFDVKRFDLTFRTTLAAAAVPRRSLARELSPKTKHVLHKLGGCSERFHPARQTRKLDRRQSVSTCVRLWY